MEELKRQNESMELKNKINCSGGIEKAKRVGRTVEDIDRGGIEYAKRVGRTIKDINSEKIEKTKQVNRVVKNIDN
ncbi:hypothetical protein F8M41_022394 [Gigaspora margarita]|uniref:Uncharacterized protein n=1 Tax=Gigaspora margarita TaxID=4874 RepID=A0A8H4AF43_GIGMA|nr:hypothetical protein F8M41_022394 [Gigaspora margarita]